MLIRNDCMFSQITEEMYISTCWKCYVMFGAIQYLIYLSENKSRRVFKVRVHYYQSFLVSTEKWILQTKTLLVNIQKQHRRSILSKKHFLPVTFLQKWSQIQINTLIYFYFCRYECDCSDTGFYGTLCELNINDCEPNPCAHGEDCLDGIKVSQKSRTSCLFYIVVSDVKIFKPAFSKFKFWNLFLV